MKRIKVKLIGDGSRLNPYHVNLPTYVLDFKRDPVLGTPIVGESGYPIDDVDYKSHTCYVLVPDDEVDEYGRLNEARIREKYREGWSNFKSTDVEAP